MNKLSLFLFLFLIHLGVKPINTDSLKLKLDRLSIPEQLKLIDELKFNDVIGNCHKITPILLKYERIAIENKNFNSLAKIYANLSLSNYYLGKYDDNLKYGLKALHLYDSLGDKSELGTIYGELGYQMKYRDFFRATELMHRGVAILEKVGAPEPLAKIYDNYGVLKEINNQLDSAKYFYLKALRFKKELKDSIGIPYSLNNISMIYILKHRYDSAIYYLNESTKIRRLKNEVVGLAENYGYFGQIYASTGNYDKAIKQFLESLELAKKYNYTSQIRNIYNDLSSVYEKMNDYQNALIYHKLFKQYGDSLINIETNKAIANLQVQFETSEKEKALIQRSTQLKQQKVIKISILISSVILLTSSFIFFWNKILLIRRNEKIQIQNALIEGEQAERNRLALELHDSVANDLNGVILLLNNSKDQNNTKDNTSINRSIEKLNQTHQQVRKLSHTLMPRTLTEKGLKYAIHDLAIDFNSSDFKIDLQLIGIDERLMQFIEFNVFCIIQEALNNIVKHSKATNVFIECNKVDDILFVNIEDNGVGFDADSTKGKNGIGIQNITNRVKMMEGSLAINSSVGNGTTIEIQVALK
jgi:signal transduction histidine kinase